MKVANILIVYRGPEQVKGLIRVMTSHPGFDCWVHVDAKSDLTPYIDAASNSQVRFVQERVSVNWAGFSFVQAMLTSMREILDSGEHYDFINLMSGQDYPIKPLDSVYNFLSQNKGKSFIHFEKAPSTWWHHAKSRVTRYHLTDYSFRGKYKVEKFLNKMLPARRFYSPYELYGGPNASYWTLSMEAAELVLNYMNTNRLMKWYLKHTWAPDEFLFSTILMNSHLKDQVVNQSLRFIDWSQGGARPSTLGMEAFERLKSSSKLFARKFDCTTDSIILGRIEEELLAVNDDLARGNCEL